MGGFRARDADRERYVEVIETAYVDGQLGDQDRELRISRALTAETLDELDGLTRDLQNQPAPVVVRPTPPPVVVQPPSAPPPEPVAWPVPPKPGALPKVIGSAVAGIVALSAFALVTSSQQSVEPLYPSEDYSQLDWIDDTSVPDGGYELAAPDVRMFVRRYGARFSTTEAVAVTFFSYQARVQVPAGESRRGGDLWTWDGTWRSAGGQGGEPTTGVVDLSTLDVPALFRNVTVASTGLGVADAEVQRIELRPSADGRGRVTIHVRDGSGGRAVLETTLTGSRVSEDPFEG